MATSFDISSSGLELNRGCHPPIAHPMAKEEDKYPYYLPDGLQVSYDEKPSSLQATRACGFRSTTLILSVALALVTLLAITAAAVGGALAAKRAHCIASVDRTSSSAIPQTLNSSCPVANGTTSPPTNECVKISPTYVSSLSNVSFKVSCNTAMHDYNILGVYVYRFEDCMEACASYNHFQSSNDTCYGVTFDLRRPLEGGKGNCFLKDMHDINATAINGVSSAVLVSG